MMTDRISFVVSQNVNFFEKPLRIKVGFDPTSPDLHLGHYLLVHKLCELQKLGHEIIIIVGNFTAKIGDPTGNNSLRPVLSNETILQNAETYTSQLFKFLDKDKTRVLFNSTWLDKYKLSDFLGILSSSTIQQLLERNDFKQRLEVNTSVYAHEILYPILQGLDSVEVKADVEFGGSDQLFNLMMGRELQKKFGQKQQTVITLPILVGLDGKEKMSKSKGNYIGFLDSAEDVFGKVMSISDSTMWNWINIFSHMFTVNTSLENPRDIKLNLAYRITNIFHSSGESDCTRRNFIEKFSHGKVLSDIPTFTLQTTWSIIDLLIASEFCSSRNEARRKLSEGAVKINGIKILENIKPIHVGILSVGRKNIRLIPSGFNSIS